MIGKFFFWRPENFSKKTFACFLTLLLCQFQLKMGLFLGGVLKTHIFNKEKALFIKIFNNFYSQTVYYTNISGKK